MRGRRGLPIAREGARVVEQGLLPGRITAASGEGKLHRRRGLRREGRGELEERGKEGCRVAVGCSMKHSERDIQISASAGEHALGAYGELSVCGMTG